MANQIAAEAAIVAKNPVGYDPVELTAFSQLLEPAGIAPALDYAQTNRLVYASAPSLETRAQIRFVIGTPVVFRRGSEDEVRRLLRHWRAELSPTLESSDEDLFVSGFDDDESLKDLASEAPIIRLVNHLFARALDLDASDIHFEPSENTLDVRCRVDGIMTRIERLPIKIHTAVASRLKLMARLDIGEKRLPQDGRIDYKLGAKQLDMRVSTLPGVHGESIVLRILDRSDTAVELVELGMPQDLLASYENVVTQPHGMVLITGPTGSGKTTTLYATLEKISNEKQKIITVEDPVEYDLPGISQTQINLRAGMTFARGLKAILRQDPDVILIGEIRDGETAEIATQSSLTGHLVLSTLHTNTAAGAITRLQDLGVDSFLLASTIRGILSQRLLRKLCHHCRCEVEPNEFNRDLLKLKKGHKIYEAGGCEKCNSTGYAGRQALFELVTVDAALQTLIHENAGEIDLEAKIREQVPSIRQAGFALVGDGMTTIEEVLRVTSV